MRSFTDIKDISSVDIKTILERTKKEKRNIKENGSTGIEKILAGKSVALIFEKPSTRTRVSFEVGITQLGGKPIILQAADIQLSRGETVADTAKVLSRYVDLIVIRCFKHEMMLDFSVHASVPVINGLTNLTHPCQVMSDILTIEESKGKIQNQDIIWLGDGNNVARSWVEASEVSKLNLTICTPENLSLPENLIKGAISKGAKVKIDND